MYTVTYDLRLFKALFTPLNPYCISILVVGCGLYNLVHQTFVELFKKMLVCIFISIGLKYRPLQLRTALSLTLLNRFVFKLHYEHIQFKKKRS